MHTATAGEQDTGRDVRSRTAEQIYREWDDALGKKDVDAAVRLYASDATLESPLVRHLLGEETGVLAGHDRLRSFIALVFQRTPPLRQRFRSPLFTDGALLMWEYPRIASGGEQMDFVEVMEVREGLIRHHRVYWGWRGLQVLERNEYRNR
jgi:hypothetical protein